VQNTCASLMFRPTSKSAVLTRLSMRARLRPETEISYTGAFATLAPPLACSSIVWRLKLLPKVGARRRLPPCGEEGPVSISCREELETSPSAVEERRIPRVSQSTDPPLLCAACNKVMCVRRSSRL